MGSIIFLGFFVSIQEEDIIKIKNDFSFIRYNWVNPNNYHITLKYLGYKNNEEIKKIKNYFSDFLKKDLSNIESEKLELNSLNFFEFKNKPRVLYIDIKNFSILNKLKNEIEQILQKNKITTPKDYKKFNPHLTLCRIKENIDINTFKEKIKKYENHTFGKINKIELKILKSKYENNKVTYVEV